MELYERLGIKAGKEGRKMPGVKGMHQESEDVSKPEWGRGHYTQRNSNSKSSKRPKPSSASSISMPSHWVSYKSWHWR